MTAGNDIHFSIPVERMSGFKAVIRESNEAARAQGIKVLRPIRYGKPTNGIQPMLLRCADRREVLVCELMGFIQDAEDGRKFQRTRESEKHW